MKISNGRQHRPKNRLSQVSFSVVSLLFALATGQNQQLVKALKCDNIAEESEGQVYKRIKANAVQHLNFISSERQYAALLACPVVIHWEGSPGDLSVALFDPSPRINS